MGSEDNDRERMRDIVERLELQAFVADKIQSGMKPLIMDCLNEITNLRIDNAKFYAQAEMNARLLTENASLRAENEKLRDAYDTDALTISYNLGYTCGKDIVKDRIESAEQAYVRLDASMNRLKAAFRVNMLRAFPHMSHDEIDAEIAAAIRESGNE